MSIVNIGIVGLGTVGSGVVRLVQRHHDDYLRSYGIDLRIKRACARSERHRDELGLPDDVFTTDWHDVVADPEVHIVVELIGGDHPATEIFEAAIKGGKHVVSANKSLLAHDMGRLAKMAHESGVQIKCEAACAGGIPIVQALESSFAGNEVLTIAGIVNGTTNYMLTRMEHEGMGFDEVLRVAQELGYAEADPTADVDGWDAANKMAVLATMGFNTRVELDDISCVEGIRSLSATDVAYAGSLGLKVKLLGVARKTPEGLDIRVHPAMIPADHQLASVEGVFNAVYVVGDAVGETMFFGAGAGMYPTASAVMGDILALAEPISRGAALLSEAEPFDRVMPIRSIDDHACCYYLRVKVADTAGMLSDFTSVVAKHGVSIASISQPGEHDEKGITLIVTTHLASERSMKAALEDILALPGIAAEYALIRMEDTAAWKAATL